MDETTAYKSIPTTPDSQFIRVLDVHAPQKSHDEPIQGELRTIDLTLNPIFSTLSYVWGDSDGERRFVHCGSHQIPLLPNGYSALKALRKKLGKFTIWIDAICINQDDDDEKQRQIPLMGEIYSKAESGYIWLGLGDPRVKRALEYLSRPPFEHFFQARSPKDIEKIRPMYYSAALAFIWQRFKLRSTRSPARRHFWTLPFSTTMDDVEVLLQNEWVERVWTYQELLLSRKPILVYGSDHLDWDTFAISVGSLDYATSVNIWFNLALVSSLTFVNIIDVVLKRKSKYVHDKAFGMQSILQTLAKERLKCSPPDYKQELVHVFRELNIQILTAIG
ncbi:Heterokaryon incompatibility protein (HET) domain containing protein, partial [Rhypophila sp. PSN 637]